jgi:hypothetical protein
LQGGGKKKNKADNFTKNKVQTILNDADKLPQK